MINARLIIAATTAEEASLGIAKALLSRGNFTEVHADVPYDCYRNGDCLLLIDSVPLADDTPLDWERHFTCDCIVIVYRHSGRGGKQRMTVHPVGNPTDKPLMGTPNALGAIHALYQRHMLKTLKDIAQEQKSDYLVNYEATHHGPTHLKTSVFFVEVGDSEAQWKDVNAHQLLAEAIERFIGTKPENLPSVLGLGGDHYAERFERRTFSEGWAFGHMIAERDFGALNDAFLQELVTKTIPKLDLVVIDKKKQGTPEQRELIQKFFKGQGIEVKKI